MNQIVYEPPQDGVVWSLIVFLFLVAVTIAAYIWSKLGNKK